MVVLLDMLRNLDWITGFLAEQTSDPCCNSEVYEVESKRMFVGEIEFDHLDFGPENLLRTILYAILLKRMHTSLFANHLSIERTHLRATNPPLGQQRRIYKLALGSNLASQRRQRNALHNPIAGDLGAHLVCQHVPQLDGHQ